MKRTVVQICHLRERMAKQIPRSFVRCRGGLDSRRRWRCELRERAGIAASVEQLADHRRAHEVVVGDERAQRVKPSTMKNFTNAGASTCAKTPGATPPAPGA